MASGEGDGGSTAWHNAFRSRLYLTTPKAAADAEPETDVRLLQRRKANYAASHDEIPLRWVDGAFHPDGLPEGVGETQTLAHIRQRNCEEVFLQLLGASSTAGRRVSDSKNAQNYAPRAFTKSPDRRNYTRTDFERAMERLFADKKIKMESYGPPSAGTRHIVRVESGSK